MFQSKIVFFVISPNEISRRIDHFLVSCGIPLSRSSIQKLIREGGVRVNGDQVKPNYRLRERERIEVSLPHPPCFKHLPEDIPIDILFEDHQLIVLNKPAGLVVHPAPGHNRGTLVNALLHHIPSLPDFGNRERPGIVHRLDKDTSGVMVVAKELKVYLGLVKQFKKHTIKRKYLALVVGYPGKEEGKIDLSIGRDTVHRKKISSRTRRPRYAVTLYQVRERFKDFTLLEILPETGRTHQIRVHLSSIRHPIMGDSVYGKRGGKNSLNPPVSRQMLHAWVLGFIHPGRNEYMEFESSPPADMEGILETLRVQGG